MNIKKFLILPLTLSSLIAVGCIAVANNFGIKGSHVTNAASLPTIGEIISAKSDFPLNRSKSWLSENGDRAYVENDNLVIEDSTGLPKCTYPLGTALEVGVGDFIYNDYSGQIKVGVIHFRVIDNVLQDIRYESTYYYSSSIAGTYIARNYVTFVNDDDNIENLNPNRSADEMVLPTEKYNLYILEPKNQGQSNFFVELHSFIGEDKYSYGCISLNPKDERMIDHLAYSFDGVNYTNITSYDDYCEGADENAVFLQDITGCFYIKSVGASSHTLLTKHDKLDATCEQDGHLAYYECECDNLYFEDQTLLKKIGDETALDAWLKGAGKIASLEHHGVKQDGKAATTTEAGWKDYYKCSGCDEYFEDLECLHEITDLEAWKAGAGKIEKLPESAPEKLSAGAIVGIAVGSVVGVSLISYGALLLVFIKTKKAPKFLIKSFEAIIKLFKK